MNKILIFKGLGTLFMSIGFIGVFLAPSFNFALLSMIFIVSSFWIDFSLFYTTHNESNNKDISNQKINPCVIDDIVALKFAIQ